MLDDRELTAFDGLTVAELGRLLDLGALSAEALVLDTCRRIESVGGPLNAVATSTAERAMVSARAADEMRSLGMAGPLLGIPYGVKDIIDVAGTATTCGSAATDHAPKACDADVVARLDGAGASLVAKFALAELIGLAATDPTSSAFGPAHNPWDPSRWAGGSSGGSAAAVAAGLVPFALGSETAGSIGSPAAWCGVTGLRPSYGAVSTAGVAPLAPTLDKVGVLARSADDCAVVFDVLTGSAPVRDGAASATMSSMTIGFVATDFDGDAPAEMAGCHADALAVIGHVARLVESPGLPERFDYRTTLDTIMQAEGWHSFEHLRADRRLELVRDDHARTFLAGEPVDADRYRAALDVRRTMVEELRSMFEHVDAVVTTNFALPWPIPAIGEPWSPVPILDGNTAMVWASNLTGLPAVSIPIGSVDGLPVGVQFVGPIGSDRRLMALAHAVQKETEWHRQRPPIGLAA